MKDIHIGITVGDPAGIGPEIVVKALRGPLNDEAQLWIIAGLKVMERAVELCDAGMNINRVEQPSSHVYRPGALNLIDPGTAAGHVPEYGKVQAAAGKAAYACIEKAASLALEGSLDAIVTGPVNKQSLLAAGVPHIGHTEILAELTGVSDPLTMFQVSTLRVFFLSRHVSLQEACGLVTRERLLVFIQRCMEALKQIGVPGPLLAVAALNPHAGENGRFGREELDALIPAVEEAIKRGYRVEGPVPADAVFHQALQGKYDAVLSLYHDQGHIATKMVDFERTVSITHNLPFLRTSVDHGTAFDIAGQGIASPVSMEESIRLATQYGSRWKNKDTPHP